MSEVERKKQADYILHECNLLKELEKYGVPHIIGSYRMDMMAWNDLDIDIENDGMSLDKLHGLTSFILKTFHPTWYEAKEEITVQGQTVWFHGFETIISGELWNIDLWFLDKKTIENAEKYCDDITEKVSKTPDLRETIVHIKQELIARNLYSFDQYTSMDVYEAVLNNNIRDIDDFLHYQND